MHTGSLAARPRADSIHVSNRAIMQWLVYLKRQALRLAP